MTYEDLQALARSFDEKLTQACRCYAIDDKHVVDVEVRGMSLPREGKEPHLFVQLRIFEIFPTDEDTQDFEECDDLNALAPATIVRFAEIKATVDSWKAGTLLELPPSTTTLPVYRRRPARLHRMHRRLL